MSYIGVQPTAGQYRKLDNISSGFNGSTTSFTTSVSGTNVTAGTAQQLLVSLGGVIQQPDTDYTVSTNTITFTTAPTSGLTFFAVLMGDALNTVTTSDGAITTAKLAGSLSVGLAAGTASAPSLYFTGDTNTGIYSLGADQVAISTGGTGRLFVDSSGRVGIGTSTVGSSGNANITIAGANNSGIQFSRTNATAGGGLITSASGPGISFFHYSGAVGSETYTEGMRLTSTGLGIGVTAPASPLEIRGTSSGQNILHVSNTAGSTDGSATNAVRFSCNGDNAWANARYHAYTHVWNFGGSASTAEAARIDQSGRLLVGTSSARSTGTVTWLSQIEGGSLTGLGITTNGNDTSGAYVSLAKSRGTTLGSSTIVQNNDVLGAILFSGADGVDADSQAASIQCNVDGTPGANDMPGRIVLATTADGASSPTEAMRIDSNQNTSLISKLNADPLYIGSRDAAGTTRWIIYAGHSATAFPATFVNSFGVFTNGNVVNTNNSYSVLSDIKLKENIVDAKAQWDDIKALRIVNYNFKPETNYQTHKQLGLIAQEVEQICPGLVYETPDRDSEGNDLGTVTKLLNSSVLYMKAVKALQEAMERIEQLEAKVTALESA